LQSYRLDALGFVAGFILLFYIAICIGACQFQTSFLPFLNVLDP
jgi:hypothetical protein